MMTASQQLAWPWVEYVHDPTSIRKWVVFMVVQVESTSQYETTENGGSCGGEDCVLHKKKDELL
jgi:hypothetical protein